jgi:dihydrofolate reductase
MRKIRYGVAASLDGYIAGPNGEYDWIPMDPDIDFAGLAAQFDTYLMGRRTFELYATMGGYDNVWIFSNTKSDADYPGATIVNGKDDIVARLNELRTRPGKDIALYGGGVLFRSLLELGMVDTVEVAVVPVLLGEGIPLLPSPAARHKLKLTNHTVYPKTGTVLLQYDIVPAKAARRGAARSTASATQAPAAR